MEVVQPCPCAWELTASTPIMGVMHSSLECKISGGHETEVGKQRGNMVYKELPSLTLWEWTIPELPCGFFGLAWQFKCFYLVTLGSCQDMGKLQHLYWTYNYYEQDLSWQWISSTSIAQTPCQNHHMDKFKSFTAMDYPHAHQSHRKPRGQ